MVRRYKVLVFPELMFTVAVLVNTVLPPPTPNKLSIAPPLQVNGPAKTGTLVPSIIPSGANSNAGLMRIGAAISKYPLLLTRCSPLPVKLAPEIKVSTPPPKFKMQLALALKVPLLVPPLSRLSVPLKQVTRFALLTAACREAPPAPLDFFR